MLKRKATLHLRFNFWLLIKIFIILFILLFLIYPFGALIIRSFLTEKEPGFTMENFIKFFSKNYYYKTLGHSLLISTITTIITLIIGVPMAYIMSRYNVIGKKYLNIFIIMSLMSPPFIGAYSWIVLFGRSGFITKLLNDNLNIVTPSIYGRMGIIIVFVFKLFPYVYLYTLGAIGSIDSSLEEAAESLGSSKLNRIKSITIPLLIPSITAGAIMVFMTSLADFGTPMLIGEGYMVLPVLVYNEYMSEMGGNAHLASALSLIIVICAILLLVLQKYYVSKKNYTMTTINPPKEVKLNSIKRVIISFGIALITLIGILPQIVVLISSFIKTNYSGFSRTLSFDNYSIILNRLTTNIKNTFVFSSLAIIIIILIGILISFIIIRQKGLLSNIMDFLIMFPFVIPGAVLGISLIIAFNKKPVILTGTAFIMIIAFVIRKLPYTVRSSSAYLQQMDQNIEEASINLGVSPMKTFFKITIRVMAPGILSGAILSWITCINELSSSVMLYGGKTSTISVAIYTEIIRNSYGTAAALASILTFSSILSLALFLKISKGKLSLV